MFHGILVALCTGARSLAESERLTDEISPAARKALGLKGRLPDTTARDLLVKLEPEPLRRLLRIQTRKAWRRKALAPQGLPFGVVTIDGKATAIDSWAKGYAQRQNNRGRTCGVVRTITCTLVSSRSNICIDVAPIPPRTSEDGHYKDTLSALLRAYGRLDLFRLIVADAGYCSKSNADFTRAEHLHYLYRLNEKQPTLFAEAERLMATLGDEDADCVMEHRERGKTIRRSLFITEEMAGFLDWSHLVTVLRVKREEFDARGQIISTGNRYFMSSMRSGALTPKQWLETIRGYWGSVESGCHKTFDVAFEEDKRPWITGDDQGMLAVLLLRRLAYNLMELFKTVTQRSAEKRAIPWADLMRSFGNSVLLATSDCLSGLKHRPGLPNLE